MKIQFLLFAVLSAFASCKPDPMELDIPQAEQKIVMASQQLEGNIFVVALSRSYSALEKKNLNLSDSTQPLPEELLVKNATVHLELNGTQIQLNEWSPGVYFTESLQPEYYQMYTLNIVDNEKGQHTKAQTMMLPQVSLDSLHVEQVYGSTNQYTMHYAFTDIPAVNNWYVINFYTKDNAKDTLNGPPNDLDYIARRLTEQRLDFDLISQQDIVSGKYTITKTFTNNKLDTFGISLSNISQGYYEFLLAQKKNKSITNKIRGEVINTPTNAINGYGYFSMHTPFARFFYFDK